MVIHCQLSKPTKSSSMRQQFLFQTLLGSLKQAQGVFYGKFLQRNVSLEYHQICQIQPQENVLSHKSFEKAWCLRGYNENANNRSLASKPIQKLCSKGKYNPNAIFIYSPALQMTVPLRIDCSSPLSPAQTQIQNTPCHTEATHMGSDKKDTQAFFFLYFFEKLCEKDLQCFQGAVRQKTKTLFGIFLLSLICHVLIQGTSRSVFCLQG